MMSVQTSTKSLFVGFDGSLKRDRRRRRWWGAENEKRPKEKRGHPVEGEEILWHMTSRVLVNMLGGGTLSVSAAVSHVTIQLM